ncbi:PEP-CTERM sorting domain-containing protein [Crocosphaera sp. XPORK-15E]|uniref:PEP-CTERM sorting domain-containing protein n=1 Tax=Crocosphaera sp. XPORK-15E TaxID=3110247 RepID=UPI002B1F4C9D|nr:PEP-CTERM sorting domain-containing protein [Crocosphaera sp. XPORK-15E]MEA5533569.1 PEP-CTERM sorting domain-containing protein [Crocosphaera sp. XPORK-15E]
MKNFLSSSIIMATASASLGLTILPLKPAQAVTVSYAATADTFIDSNNPNTSYGTSSSLVLGEVLQAPMEQNILLRFDNLIPTAPGQYAINVKATLTMQAIHNQIDVALAGGFAVRNSIPNPTPTYLQPIIPWQDTTSPTYNMANDWIDTETPLFTGPITRLNNGLTTFQGDGLNNLVQQWLNGNINNGLAIEALITRIPGTLGNFDEFASRNQLTRTVPTLNITYDLVQVMPFQVEIRTGGGGQGKPPGDWEVALQTPGSNTPLPGTQISNLVWQNGVNKNWELVWDRVNNDLTFTIGGITKKYTEFSEPLDDFLRGLRVLIKSETDETDSRCIVAPGTGINFQVNQYRQQNSANFTTLSTPWTASAISPDPNTFDFLLDRRLNDRNFALNNLLRPIEAFKGTVGLSWEDENCNPQLANGRSRTEVIIQGLGRLRSTSATLPTNDAQSIPEPTSAIGLLGLGILGLLRLRRSTSK